MILSRRSTPLNLLLARAGMNDLEILHMQRENCLTG